MTTVGRMPDPVRVYVVDDHDDVRRALVERLRSAPDVQVVGEAASGEAALREVSGLRPDVVLVETKRGDGRGLEIVHGLVHSELRATVVVLTSYPSEWERWAAYRAGAGDYLLKDIGSDQLIGHIRTAVRSRLPPSVHPAPA